MSSEAKSIIAVFKSADSLESLLNQLKKRSLAEQISVISKSDVEQISDLVETSAESKTAVGAGVGAAAGVVVGLLGGIGMVVPIVGLGSVFAAGLMGSMSGATLGSYLGAIYSARFAEETKYDVQEALEAGALLLTINVETLADEKIDDIQALLNEHNAEFVETATINFDVIED